MISGSGLAELLTPPQNSEGRYSMNLAQATGATGSYSDKIALENVLGIGASEDADHNNYAPTQADPEFHTSYLNVKKATPSSTITDKQIKLIEVRRNAMKAGNPSAYIEFQAWYALNFGEKPLKELTKAEASKLIDQLNG